MQETTIRIFHTDEVCVAPALLFGGEHCSALKASGVFAKKSERLWLPVFGLSYRRGARQGAFRLRLAP